MSPLKIGKLPDRETTKITFAANEDLKDLLSKYANAYEQEYGKAEKIENLIPHMLETFIKTDRGFRNARLISTGPSKTDIE